MPRHFEEASAPERHCRGRRRALRSPCLGCCPRHAQCLETKAELAGLVQSSKHLKIFFIVEPGPLEVQAHLLVASLLLNCRDAFSLQAFCRTERMAGLQAETLQFLSDCGVRLQAIDNDFHDGYPAGNKLIAAGAVSDADWFLFLDTDMVMIRPASILAEAEDGKVAMCLDTINGWSEQPSQWQMVYGAFGLPVPDEVISYPHGNTGPPLFNAGLILFPGAGPERRHFGWHWLKTARALDALPGLARKRPWLDTIAILPTIGRFPQFGPTRLSRVWNNTTSLARDDAKIIHYHGLRQIKEFGWLDRVDAILGASRSPYDSVWHLAYHYKRDLGAEGDLFRRAMRHGLHTLGSART